MSESDDQTTEREERRSGLPTRHDPDPIDPPDIEYKPADPREYDPGIGMIGTGAISEVHLEAYRNAGYDVVALYNRTAKKARKKRDEFYPDADVHTEYDALLSRDDIDVVDITIPVTPRIGIIEDAIAAEKHILSQKPFVNTIETGRRLTRLAAEKDVKLAVNQNGRWAPHFSYIRSAIANELLGEIVGAHVAVHWNHDRPDDERFDTRKHAILYDFAIHWFDMVNCIVSDKTPRRVYASRTKTNQQIAEPPLLGQCLIEYDGAQASLVFDGHTQYGPRDTTYVAGTDGTIMCQGPEWQDQSITVYTDEGYAEPELEGAWFPDGFHGAMGELLCAIEEDREPAHSARNNIESLEVCFAAVHSAMDREPKVPGETTEVEPTID